MCREIETRHGIGPVALKKFGQIILYTCSSSLIQFRKLAPALPGRPVRVVGLRGRRPEGVQRGRAPIVAAV
jgi:hypothetical protein